MELDLTAAITDAFSRHISVLVEVLITDNNPMHSEDVNEEAIANFTSGLGHLIDLHAKTVAIARSLQE